MGDLRDQIRHDENALQRLMDAIPGFREYRQQEIRRSADRILRDHLVGLLEKVRGQLTTFQRELAESKQLKLVTDVGRVTRSLVRVIDRIEHASYGYAGFLDALKIREAELDRMYDYDLALKEFISTLEEGVESLRTVPPEDHPESLRKLAALVDELGQLVDGRNEFAAELAL